jgi:hypothetical protein
MPNVIETAPSGRAKCRGCGRSIARGEWRFGERQPNRFAEGEMTLWFHLKCAAYKRPEPFLRTLTEMPETAPGREVFEEIARRTLAHRRLPRIDGAERAPGSMARCRSCHEPIERGNWRIRLVFYEEGMFSSGGFVHPRCSGVYFETDDVWDHLLHFTPNLTNEEREELRGALEK